MAEACWSPQGQRPSWPWFTWLPVSPDAHGMDLFAVAVHEFGHAIGLGHVAATRSIMRPYYHGPVGDPLRYRLPYEDRVRVWQLYEGSEMPGTPKQSPREGLFSLLFPLYMVLCRLGPSVPSIGQDIPDVPRAPGSEFHLCAPDTDSYDRQR
ncbi:hypothetical protein P7K49_020664 [Saguinus oedipus]|uniref:Peptidase M10 metallopeptidase domain-containing protein n=1 Tax=Saguinus oedipus TaxID=9490 RepID=A0ABQ9V3J6_SAGOE|nr:hypothetical protein P7K49_020664 [Saguinus oedipus]